MNGEQIAMTLARIEQKLDALTSQVSMLNNRVGKGTNLKSWIRRFVENLPADEVFDAIDEEEMQIASAAQACK